MARYVDLDKVDEHKNSYCNTTSITHCNRDCAECFYDNGGAEDVAPVVHAKWGSENCDDEWWGMSYKCGICGDSMIGKSNYCPNCGAKMDKE